MQALKTRPDVGYALIIPSIAAINVGLFTQLSGTEKSTIVRSQENGPALLWGSVKSVREQIEREPEYASSASVSERASVTPDVLLDLSTDKACRQASRDLLKQTVKPTDGFISRNFNRYISRFFSYYFLRLRMKPMHASAINLVIGLLSAYFAAQTGWTTMVLAGLLFQFASAFDGVDGEMARAALGESELGAWVDTAVDNTTYVACLSGVVVGWIREGVGTAGVILAAFILVGVVFTLLILFRFVRRYGPEGSLVFVDRCVERAARDTGRPSLRIARLLFYALRRDLFAALFCVICFSGVRASVFALVMVGLVIASATLLGHWPRLVAAAVTLRNETR